MYLGLRFLLCLPGNILILLICNILLMSHLKIFGTIKLFYLRVLLFKMTRCFVFLWFSKSHWKEVYTGMENPLQYAHSQ